ncbi:hypothetical protein PF002_g2888 [Phytophthora fragariae]|uniref:Uncharacterized protein n=1 Tax=Phytophthora fragariae TaxID=53985 RepID=A0A6A3M4N0_9STRA|nr:hypothetical protein PF011_g4079 [Phytophthora fragariae]KAE9232198.1 hypothetical protein PF004_g9983 [Phytophthora fragariae]KAE9254355.1 hypothetical protein PF002_g2888 [Phytophthora fragariae]
MAIFLGDDNPPETLVVGSGPLLELLPEKLVMGGDLVEELVVNGDLLPEKLVAGSEPPEKLVMVGDMLPDKLVVGSEPLETPIVVIFLLGELAAGAA